MKHILRFLVVTMFVSVLFVMGGIQTGGIGLLQGFCLAIALTFSAGLLARVVR